MKTGRVRKKANVDRKPTSPPKPATPKKTRSRSPSRPASSGASPPPDNKRFKPANGKVVGALLLGTFGCFALVMILFTALGARKADAWVPVSQARGEWTTTVKIWGPQVTREERWEADCRGQPQATVQAGTCVRKDTQQSQDQVVDEYDEYAYNIYYEETYEQVYEARGTEFVATELGTDDWWQEDLHYTSVEELDPATCEYTNYTTWVDDPDDAAQEIEVYLSECEVWDHVTVSQRVYEQANWCTCDLVTVVELGQEVQQGTGASIRWSNSVVPAGGRSERAFEGRVTFQGDDVTYTTTTADLAAYQDYLTGEYYIGLDDGGPIRVSKNPK